MKKQIKIMMTVVCMMLLVANSVFAGLNDGLAAYWSFDGNANDGSGNGNNGTVYGASLTSDRFGTANSAVSFDGVNDFISFSDVMDNSWDNVFAGQDKGFTISAWIRPNELFTTPYHGAIVSKYADSNLAEDQRELMFFCYEW